MRGLKGGRDLQEIAESATADEPEHAMEVDDEHGTEPGDQGREVKEQSAPA